MPSARLVRFTFLTVSLTVLSAAPLDTPSWLAPIVPQKGLTLRDEIKCYSLPYGAIGFISHLLTYWVVLCLGFSRRPYWPARRLSAGRTDLLLSLTQIAISVAITSYTIARCRSRWQFMLIAIWKLVMSVEVGIFGLRAAWIAMRHQKYTLLDKHYIWTWDDPTPYTLIIYAMGVVVGMTGLLSIVWQLRHDWQIVQISAVFFSVTAFIFLVCGGIITCRRGGSLSKPLMAMFFTFVLVCSLYSDWILGDIAGGLVGVPSGDNSVLYWTYFAAKRLPLLMT